MQGSSRAAGAAREEKRPRRKVWWLLILFPVLLAAAVFAFGCVMKFGTTIYPNVTVCGVQVGGMSRDEAMAAVQEKVDATYGTYSMKLTLPDRVLTFTPEETSATLDVAAAIEMALDYGREGDPISCIFRWKDCQMTSHDVDITRVVNVNTEHILRVCTGISASIDKELKPATVVYNEETQTITVTAGVSERHADPAAMLGVITDAYSRGDFEGATYDYKVTYYEPVDLTEYYMNLCTPMVDAVYDETTRTLIRDQVGFGFDLEKEQQRVYQAEDGETITIQLVEMRPSVTVEMLKDELFPDVLGTYTSPLDSTNVGRTTNLILACEAINGTTINPDEIFSFNDIVGERTAEKGYQPGTVYLSEGVVTAQIGGGICQVASTIYMTSLLADMEIVERQPHMYAVSYVPLGMDAAIYWGQLDYRFRNCSIYPIYIEASVVEEQNIITIRGTKTDNETVNMTYAILTTIPWEEIRQVDETKPTGYSEVRDTPYTGYIVQTYRERYDDTGKLVSTQREAYSSYKKRDKVVIVGPEPVVEPVIPDTPADPQVPDTPADPPVEDPNWDLPLEDEDPPAEEPNWDLPLEDEDPPAEEPNWDLPFED